MASAEGILQLTNRMSLEDMESNVMWVEQNPNDATSLMFMNLNYANKDAAVVGKAMRRLFNVKHKKEPWSEVRFEGGGAGVEAKILMALEEARMSTISVHRHCFVGDESSSVLSDAIKQGLIISAAKCKNRKKKSVLSVLSLCGCSFLDSESLGHIFEGLSKHESIKTAQLTRSKFVGGPEAVQSLAAGLIMCPQLEKVELFGCSLSDQECTIVVEALQQLPELTHLDLGNNRCSTSTMPALGKLISLPRAKLRTLNLSLQKSTLEQTHLDICPLTARLCWNTSLQSLYLRGNKLTLQQLEPLLLMLEKNETLEWLVLTDCLLQTEGLIYILDRLPFIGSLKYLYVDGSQGSDLLSHRTEVSNAAVKGLATNTSLELLRLPNCIHDRRDEMEYLLDLNQGGRRLLIRDDAEEDATTIAPPSLWPLVFQRLNQMELTTKVAFHKKDQKTDQRRLGVLFFLVRQQVLQWCQ